MSKEKAKRLGQALQVQYPQIFNRDDPTLLSLRIRAEIREAYPGASCKVASRFLNYWVNRTAYLRKMAESKPGAFRRHLDGTPAERLIAEHRAYARECLAGMVHQEA